jgi:hypothetical protein
LEGPLSPCRHKWSGEPRPAAHCPDRGSPTGEAANTPTGGLAVLRALDDYLLMIIWTILGALLSLTASPGKAGLRVQTGDGHTREHGAACRGPPVVRERSGIIWTLHPSRIPGPIGTER